MWRSFKKNNAVIFTAYNKMSHYLCHVLKHHTTISTINLNTDKRTKIQLPVTSSVFKHLLSDFSNTSRFFNE
jgi:hypothetical protein